MVDDEPHRSVGAVPNEIDDAFGETLVAHVGHGNQKLAFETIHIVSLGPPPSPANPGKGI
ncbi:hypothetical protein GCM10010862_01720 [Devosia nitrariae]|uniref:Uncharacterized protein n=1 Tax=Devosia nitrariae TaxID=2071872 RepID=A0ABQ5VYP3_9HYPH|nr:hypothetical protein GCM10010862_01720 [Devosia nitrariae]